MPASNRAALAALVILGWSMLSAPAASAQVDGPCTAAFNGVDVGRIDSLSSPLDLDADDVLVFQGTDRSGTETASVEVAIMMFTLDSETVDVGTLETEFRAELELGSVSTYSVGVFRVRGTTDNCIADAWLRVSGRVPVATLVGLAAAGLAIGGVVAVVVAMVTRRRLSPLTAALGGAIAGVGGAMLGQAFGRLGLSFTSLGLSAGPASLVALAAAWLRRGRPQRRDRPDDSRGFHDEREPVAPHRPDTDLESAVDRVQTPAADRGVIERSDSAPSTNGGPYWCYVMSPTEVLDLGDQETVVGSLAPGTWYLAKRDLGGWAHVVISPELEGWVSQASVQRHD